MTNLIWCYIFYIYVNSLIEVKVKQTGNVEMQILSTLALCGNFINANLGIKFHALRFTWFGEGTKRPKGKVFPPQAWTGPWGSGRLRLPDFYDFRHYEGGKVVTLTYRPPSPPGVSWYLFLEDESTPEHMVPSVASEKFASDTTGDRLSDPPTSSAVTKRRTDTNSRYHVYFLCRNKQFFSFSTVMLKILISIPRINRWTYLTYFSVNKNIRCWMSNELKAFVRKRV